MTRRGNPGRRGNDVEQVESLAVHLAGEHVPDSGDVASQQDESPCGDVLDLSVTPPRRQRQYRRLPGGWVDDVRGGIGAS
jgi:hypothetical protein